MLRRRFLAAGMLAMMSISVACAARKPGSAIRPGINLFSKEQDIQLGREAAAQVAQQMPIAKNSQLQAYIDELGKKLASTSAAGDYPYEFTLVHQDEINAFALPGGPIFVHTGLIAEAENEAQVAGVLAHEIAHVALRHGTNQVSKANLLQIPAALAGAAIGDGALGQIVNLGLGVGLNGLFLKYGRTAETQADALGARIMAEAGYNPVEMARFFEKLEAGGGSRPPEILSSHPNPGNRVKNVEAELRTFPQREYTATTGDFAQARQMVASLGKAPQRRELAQAQEPAGGGPRTDTPGGFRELQANRFALAYPGDWQAMGDRNSQVVTLAPREGLVQTQGGDVSIGYGAVLSYYQPQRARDLAGATQELVARLQQTNQSMRVRGRARQVQVDGNPGLLTTLSSQSPYGGDSETDVLLTVARPEGLFYMVFIAPSNQYGRVQGTFEQIFRSIRFAG